MCPVPSYPPVYSPISQASLGDALLATLAPLVGAAPGSAQVRVEQLLLGHYPGRRAIWTQSGTAALALAVRAASRAAASATSQTSRAMPRVALPAYACPDLGSAAAHAQAEVVLYDLDPHSLGPDLDSLRAALAEGCTQLVVTHLFGRVLDLGPIASLAREFGAVLIEDAAQHAGGSLHGVRAGAQAAWSILSFGRGKGLNAGGGGVLLCSHNAALAATDLAALQEHSKEHATLGQALPHLARAGLTEWLSHPLLYGMVRKVPALGVGATTYHELTHVGAPPAGMYALLRSALLQEPGQLAIRRSASHWYREQLSVRPDMLVAPSTDEAHQGALRFPLRLPNEATALDALGVVRSYPRTLHAYPEIAARVVNLRVPMPGAQQLAQSLFTLPTHPRTTHALRTRIVQELLRLP